MLKTKIMTFLTVACLVSSVAIAQKKYILKSDALLLKKSHQIALSQVGTTEPRGRNDGPQVAKYLAACGLGGGQPYCAAGQYYCFVEASRALKMPLSAVPIPKTALAQSVYNYARRCGQPANYQPSPHDMIVWRRGQTTKGHIERIHKVLQNGWVETIAFNSSKVAHGRKIEGVFIQKRNIRHPLGRLKIKGIVGFDSK